MPFVSCSASYTINIDMPDAFLIMVDVNLFLLFKPLLCTLSGLNCDRKKNYKLFNAINSGRSEDLELSLIFWTRISLASSTWLVLLTLFPLPQNARVPRPDVVHHLLIYSLWK